MYLVHQILRFILSELYSRDLEFLVGQLYVVSKSTLLGIKISPLKGTF